MMIRIPLASAVLVVLVSCATAPPVESDFYSWLDLRRAEFNLLLDSRDVALLKRKEAEIAAGVERRYEQIVRETVREKDPDLRASAAFALGFSRRPEAAAHLLALFEDPDPIVRQWAVASVGILNPPDPPLEALSRALEDPDPAVRHASLFAFMQLVVPGRDPSVGGQALSRRLEPFLTEDAPEDFRADAVTVLGQIGTPAALKRLARKLKDGSPLVRKNAAMAIGRFELQGLEAVPALIERLRDPETNVVEAAHWSLRRITGREEGGRSYQSWLDWFEQSRNFEYRCRDHPEESFPVPVTCPRCGRRLEGRAKEAPEGAAEFVCPKDSDVVAPAPGKCPRCGGELQERPR